MKDKKSNVVNLVEAQWVCGKALPRGNGWNPVEEGAERLRSSTDCDPEGRQKCDVLQTMRDVWYESRQRLENQITTFGLVSRQKMESEEQVSDSFNFPEGFSI